jgi:hypothetical protein
MAVASGDIEVAEIADRLAVRPIEG